MIVRGSTPKIADEHEGVSRSHPLDNTSVIGRLAVRDLRLSCKVQYIMYQYTSMYYLRYVPVYVRYRYRRETDPGQMNYFRKLIS
jgi:hypothetical protein